MPVAPTYPGVYIEEVPSGVRTITGVSTSVTAFIGSAKRGPINRAVRVQSFSAFERRFGGLDANSEMSYSVRQFFLNGGSDAWVVRIAKNPTAAFKILANGATPAKDVLKVSARDQGNAGNSIEVRIDYNTTNSQSTFNLTLNYVSADNPSDNRSESFTNLSMNRFDPRFVADTVNDVSELVTVERLVPDADLGALPKGTSTSGALADVATVLDVTHNEFRVSANGSSLVNVSIAVPGDIAGATPAARLASLCNAITTKVRAAAGGNPALADFECTVVSGNKIGLSSGKAGESSNVRVYPGVRNDASTRLAFGPLNGGEEVDGVASIRPKEIPDHGTIVSDVFGNADLDGLPSATNNSFAMTLDGATPDLISIGDTNAAGANLAQKMADVASRIQSVVRGLKPANPAYRDFTAIADAANKKLVLASGTRGVGSTIAVSAAGTKSIAAELHLLTGATTTQPSNVMLQGGNESAFTPADAYNLIIGDRSKREGVYALEAVDLFNLLCLPGVADPGILMDATAYAKERRAFAIVDAPQDAKTPEKMSAVAVGPAIPKTDYAAVYYPWIKIADPLQAGKLRISAPSGTIAGLMARTDSTRGVWKAPAGTDAVLTGAQGVEYVLTDPENGILNPLGVNCIRVFPVFGSVAWGARTLRGADQIASEWKYVPVRRLALFLEESLYRGTQWVVFEPNDEPLWAQIRLNAGAFMQSLFRQGAFQGKSPRDAYFVKCDRETTTQDDINRGIVNILVGFAPLKPAEFVVIKIQQMAGQIQT